MFNPHQEPHPHYSIHLLGNLNLTNSILFFIPARSDLNNSRVIGNHLVYRKPSIPMSDVALYWSTKLDTYLTVSGA